MRPHPLTVFAVVGGMTLGLLGIGSGVKPLVAAGTMLTVLGFAVAMVRCQRAGVIHTDFGILRRAENPVGFRAVSMYLWAVLLLWTLGGILHGFGRLVH